MIYEAYVEIFVEAESEEQATIKISDGCKVFEFFSLSEGPYPQEDKDTLEDGVAQDPPEDEEE